MDEDLRIFLMSSGLTNYLPEFHVCKIFNFASLRFIADRPDLLTQVVALEGHRNKLLQKLRELDAGTLIHRNESEDLPHTLNITLDTQDQDRSISVPSTSTVHIDIVHEDGSVSTESGSLIAAHIDDTDESSNDSPPRKRSKTSNGLLELLEQSVEGRYLKRLYSQSGFDNKARLRLANILVTAEYGGNTNTIISCVRFQELAAAISEAFPNEQADIYYVPAFTPVRGKTVIAKGKLYDKYTSLNKDLRETGLRELRPGQAYVDSESALVVSQVAPGDVAASLKFLHSNLRPWSSVVEHWKRTSAHRLNTLLAAHAPSESVSDYFEKYACLKQKEGYHLLEYDFDLRFPEACVRVYSHWDTFSTKVKTQLQKLGVTTENDADVLRKFPQLFSVIPVKIKNRKAWRADRPSILQGFMHMIPHSRDFTTELEAIHKEARDKHINVQPFPLLVGDRISEIEASYVVIDGKPILVENPLRAFEVAFKCYFALHCEYPIQSQRLWIVVQKTLFNIHVPYDRINPVANLPEMRRLIKALEC